MGVVREKKVHASFSSTQGIVPNLLRLVDIHSRRWHPRAGELALRLGEGLVPVSIAGLREHLVGVLKEDPKEAPACLQRQRSPSFLHPLLRRSQLTAEVLVFFFSMAG